jgi:glutathione S-transferase
MASAAVADVAQLHYFSGRGRAEQSRWVLAATQTPFRNVALTNRADFERLNEDGLLLFGQVPLLQVDGLNLVQSQAIVRYLARKHGLLGGDARESALADQVAEGAADFRGGLLSFPFSRNKCGAAACARSAGMPPVARLACARSAYAPRL